MRQGLVLTGFAVLVLSVTLATAQDQGSSSTSSTVSGSFKSEVKVNGVTQKAEGESNTQNLAVGSVEGSRVDGNFFSNVETGNIKQTISGNGSENRQDMSVGSIQNSTVKEFKSKVTAGDLSQEVKGGSNNTQEMLIGSSNNSKVEGGTFKSDVNVKNVKQTATGDGNTQSIQIGSAKNSTVKSGNFDSTVKVTGNISQIASKDVKQDLMLGSMNNAEVGSFKSNVTVNGKIEQSATGAGGHNQSATIGSVR
ncbi:MAG: hypothetical protein HXX17_10790 [Geobacteraceae bacterium]|nr:hypothetical protein [Geobacteraceae bacterium]